MKLSQINEARYAGIHPLVNWINHFIDNPSLGRMATHELNSKEQGHQAQTIITQNFGNPVAMTDNSIEWNINHNDELYHLEVRFVNNPEISADDWPRNVPLSPPAPSVIITKSL